MTLLQIDAAQAIQEGFKVSPLTGFLVLFIVLLCFAIIYIEKRRNKAEESKEKMANDALGLIKLVETRMNDISGISAELTAIKNKIQSNSCNYKKQ